MGFRLHSCRGATVYGPAYSRRNDFRRGYGGCRKGAGCVYYRTNCEVRMADDNRFFAFSRGQVKVLWFLCATALLLAVALVIRRFGTGSAEAEPLPVFLGDPDTQYTGLFVVDPNTSPADSLELLPGIGRVLADRIVAYRQEHPFRREIDITDVKGIGPKLYERIRPYLRIRP
ncbi:MAG: helix-hairpin-helix domain-containing protein [Candidatus Zixiibacteriota bacterium]|nr:MAG: helix-hairpin-helix domain-containing protein [candidate division Zixibacteria bacterium]